MGNNGRLGLSKVLIMVIIAVIAIAGVLLSLHFLLKPKPVIGLEFACIKTKPHSTPYDLIVVTKNTGNVEEVCCQCLTIIHNGTKVACRHYGPDYVDPRRTETGYLYFNCQCLDNSTIIIVASYHTFCGLHGTIKAIVKTNCQGEIINETFTN
jgi:hypothetical protein